MRAVLKLESIGDSLQVFRQRLDGKDLQAAFRAAQGLGRIHGALKWYAMMPPARPWVARITGLDSRYKYAREFVRGTKDYSEANSNGNRGVHYWYTLDDGLYQVFAHVSWKHQRRYFIRVKDAAIAEITEEELLACLNSSGPSASTCLPPPGSASPGPSIPFPESM